MALARRHKGDSLGKAEQGFEVVEIDLKLGNGLAQATIFALELQTSSPARLVAGCIARDFSRARAGVNQKLAANLSVSCGRIRAMS